MRHKDALRARAPRQDVSDALGDAGRRQWSTLDYLQAMAVTAALIAPAPFFWNPPFWVLTLMHLPTPPWRSNTALPLSPGRVEPPRQARGPANDDETSSLPERGQAA